MGTLTHLFANGNAGASANGATIEWNDGSQCDDNGNPLSYINTLARS